MDTSNNASAAWQNHLTSEFDKLAIPGGLRELDFDLDDGPELPMLAPFPRLQEAVEHLQTTLLPNWRIADHAAIRHQQNHRTLARIVIGMGTAAIIFAVLQMAVANELTSLHTLTRVLEGVAVAAGVVTVGLGLWTKGDRKWLCERNRAERLRMLKFKALGWEEIWSGDLTAWKNRVETELGQLTGVLSEEHLHEWSENERPRTESPPTSAAWKGDASFPAIKSYYQLKRLDFQRRYFEKRIREHRAAARPWRHLSLPVFLISTICVLLHFVGDALEESAEAGSRNSQPSMVVSPPVEHIKPDSTNPKAAMWQRVAVWSLTFAIIIPVAGLGVRVWLGAFEPHRSANLYACKNRAVEDLRKRLASPTEPHAWATYVSETEFFFENEHREWLHLMLETEWML